MTLEGEERSCQAGFTSLQFAVMAFFAMVIFAFVVNLVAIQYQRGAVRVAVDEAVRHGAAAGRTELDCERLAAQILSDPDSGLIAGGLGATIDVKCAVSGREMVAAATGVSEWWMGGLPDLSFTITGHAVLETFEDEP